MQRRVCNPFHEPWPSGFQQKVKRSGVQALVSPSSTSMSSPATSSRLSHTRLSPVAPPSQDPCGYPTPIGASGFVRTGLPEIKPASPAYDDYCSYLGKVKESDGSMTGCVLPCSDEENCFFPLQHPPCHPPSPTAAPPRTDSRRSLLDQIRVSAAGLNLCPVAWARSRDRVKWPRSRHDLMAVHDEGAEHNFVFFREKERFLPEAADHVAQVIGSQERRCVAVPVPM